MNSKTQFSHLHTQPLKRISSRNSDLAKCSSKIRQKTFPLKLITHTSLALVDNRSTKSICSPIKANQPPPMSKKMSEFVNRPFLKVIKKRPAMVSQTDKTFDSNMSHLVEQASRPNMQMQEAKAKSPTSMYSARKKSVTQAPSSLLFQCGSSKKYETAAMNTFNGWHVKKNSCDPNLNPEKYLGDPNQSYDRLLSSQSSKGSHKAPFSARQSEKKLSTKVLTKKKPSKQWTDNQAMRGVSDHWSPASQAFQSRTQIQLFQELGMINEEEAMPLRPMTQNNQHTNGNGTFFGSSEEHSEVPEQFIKDEMNDTGIVEFVYGPKREHNSNLISPISNQIANTLYSQSPNLQQHPAAPYQAQKYSEQFVKALEQRHHLEREKDRAKIASLEEYIDTIHAEFNKNKQLMQLLINKVEADQRLIEQANDLRISLTRTLSSKKEERGAQTEEAILPLATAAALSTQEEFQGHQDVSKFTSNQTISHDQHSESSSALV